MPALLQRRELIAGQRPGGGLVAPGTGGVVAPVANVVAFPTPSFGATSLRGWWDVRKSYTDWDGSQRLSAFYDDVGVSTVPYVEDISGQNGGWLQPDKSLQPAKGPSGGILIDGNAAYMDCVSKGMLNGLSKVSVYQYLRPLAGIAKRTGLYVSEGSSNVRPTSVSIVNGGSGFQVGDYVTASSVLKVTAVDGGGAITGIAIASPTSVGAIPSNPVAQTAASRPIGAGTGTGSSFNLTFPAIGGGSAVERLAHYWAGGTSSRKQFTTTAVADGSQLNSANATNSFGGPNNAPLTDTTTFHVVGAELDLTTGVCSYFYDGAADGTGTCASGGAFGDADSVLVRLGNNSSLNASLQAELIAQVVIGDVLDAPRRAALNAYLTSGV